MDLGSAKQTNSRSRALISTAVILDYVTIDKLYVAPHDSDNWEEDILGADTLASGETLEIKFNRAEKAPMWDLRIEDNKGNSIEWESLNLLEISKVTLNYKDGKATAKTE